MEKHDPNELHQNTSTEKDGLDHHASEINVVICNRKEMKTPVCRIIPTSVG